MAVLLPAAALAAIGFGLLAWAAAVLGWRRWLGVDSAPCPAEQPPLVLGGPFAWVRHPQTLGWLCVIAAGALVWRRPVGWVVALVAAVLLLVRARRQEVEMAQRCGEAYARYQHVVSFLVPRWW